MPTKITDIQYVKAVATNITLAKGFTVGQWDAEWDVLWDYKQKDFGDSRSYRVDVNYVKPFVENTTPETVFRDIEILPTNESAYLFYDWEPVDEVIVSDALAFDKTQVEQDSVLSADVIALAVQKSLSDSASVSDSVVLMLGQQGQATLNGTAINELPINGEHLERYYA